jgi:hypothetical protein
LDDSFDINPITSGNWTTDNSGQTSVSSGQVQFDGVSGSYTSVIFTYTKNLFSIANFTNILITVDWQGTLPSAYTNEGHWEYNTGSGWLPFTASQSSHDENFERVTESFDLNGAYLNPSTTTQFRIRFSCQLRDYLTNQARIILYSIQAKIFTSSIIDNGPTTNLNANTLVSLDFTRGVSASTYDHTWDNYLLYYRVGNADVQASPNYVTNSSGTYYNANQYLLNYQIPSSAYTVNSTLYYAFRLRDPTVSAGVYTWSSAYSVLVYDGIAPTFSGPITIGKTNATMNYNDTLSLSGSVSDTGGMGIWKCELYWHNTIGVSRTVYDDKMSQDIAGGTFNFNIPETEFTYNTKVYMRLYLFDYSYQMTTSPLIEITPGDHHGPEIIVLGASTSDVAYDQDKLLQFQINEPADAAGLDENSIECRYGVNEPNFAAAIHFNNFSKASNIWTFTLNEGNYSYNDLITVWIVAQDILNNEQILSFEIRAADLYNPIIHNVQTAFSEGLVITADCEDDAGGSGVQLVQVVVKVGSVPNWNDPVQVYTMAIQPDGKYKVTVPKSALSAGMANYIVRVTDNEGLVAETSGSFEITPGLLADPPPNPDKKDTSADSPTESNLTLIIGGVVALGATVAIGFTVIKRKQKLANLTMADFENRVKPAASSSNGFTAPSDIKGGWIEVPDTEPIAKLSKPEAPALISSPQAPEPVQSPAPPQIPPIESAPLPPQQVPEFVGEREPISSLPQLMQERFLEAETLTRSNQLDAAAERYQSILDEMNGRILPAAMNFIKRQQLNLKFLQRSGGMKASVTGASLASTSNAVKASNDASNAANSNSIFSQFDAEMNELHKNAIDFMDMGQESMANKSYEMLLHLAEKKNLSDVVEWVKEKQKTIFQ